MPKDSPLKSVADLRGKKVALNKGSNVHYLLVKALEKAGLKYTDIQPVFLAPADALAAFDARLRRRLGDLGSVRGRGRSLDRRARPRRRHRPRRRTTSSISRRRSSWTSDAKAVDVVLDALNEADDWTRNNIEAVAEQLEPVGRSAGVGACGVA